MMNKLGITEKKWSLTSLRSLSIRNRLIWGSLTIVFLAIAIMGVFVYLRTRQTNASLLERLETSTGENAINVLNSTADHQAENLSIYFASLKTNILSLREYSQNLLSNQPTLGTGIFWDANGSLSRNEKNSWDNPNSEIGSVFIPAASDLPDSMVSELNSLRQMDLVVPSIIEANPDVIAVYFGGSTGYTLYYPNIDLAEIVPADFDVTGRPWYLEAVSDSNPDGDAVWSDPYLDAALNGIVITNSAPVYDDAHRLYGVVAQDIQLTKISEAIANIRMGETGYAFLIDRERRLIAMPSSGYESLGLDSSSIPLGNELTAEALGDSVAELNPIILDMLAGDSGLSEIKLNDTQQFAVYRPIQGVNFSLAIIVPAQEMLAKSLEARQQLERENINALLISLFAILGIFVFTLFITIRFGNNLIEPLEALTRTAEEMARGNLNARAAISEHNEIGTLAITLNTMASELKESIDSLETRVAERTKEVEQRGQELEIANSQARRRAAQFEALAQVAQSISSIRDPQELLPRITSVVSEFYGFYHVGIFLIDDLNEFAVLQAANSDGGQRMLERNHRLRVGEEGIVGNVTATGEPRIALDVGTDAVYFGNPDLPDTHSEMALPLRSGGKIIGALDVQSTEVGAFSNDDLQTLSLLADQISLAIENARLFENSNRTLDELQMIMRQSTREAWKRLPEQQKMLGFRYNSMGASPLKESINIEDTGKGKAKARGSASTPYVVPIELRGEVIGNLVVQSPPGTAWNTDQQDLIRAVAERVALSAENARLFEETTQRAERERLVTEITGKIRSHNDPQAMIETAINELRSALGASRVEIIPKKAEDAPRKDSQV